ncbi:MAG: tetratricopeptide repeat protein [Deltaproteobacteria bacterium]|nr:tetratricopeptide repeat protein [Deltaproteobacteria bacterium]
MSSQYSRYLIYFVLFAVVVSGVFHRSFTADLVGDDFSFYLNNEKSYADISQIPQYFSQPSWNFTNAGLKSQRLYRPVWVVWNFLVYQIAGENSLVWHIFSLLLHLGSGMLVFLILRRVFPGASDQIRFLSTILFLSHPLASQSTIFVSASMEMLMIFFFLFSFFTYAEYRINGKPLWYISSVALFLLAMFSKELTAALFLLFIIHDWQTVPLKKLPWRLYIGFALCIVFYIAVVKLIFVDTFAYHPQVSWESITRVVTYLFVSLRLLALPWPLYMNNKHIPGEFLTFLDPVLGISVLVFAAFAFFKWREARLGITWMMIPVSLPTFLGFYDNVYYHSRQLHVSSIGIAILACLLLMQVARLREKAVLIVSAVFILPLAGLAMAETDNWKDQASLERKVLQFDKHNDSIWYNIIKAHLMKNRIDDATAVVAEATPWIPTEDARWTFGRNLILFTQEKMKDDPEVLRKMISAVAEIPGLKHEMFNEAGNAYQQKNDFEKALEYYDKALAVKPEFLLPIYNKALIYKKTGRLEEALATFRKIAGMDLPMQYVRTQRQARMEVRQLEAAIQGRGR